MYPTLRRAPVLFRFTKWLPNRVIACMLFGASAFVSAQDHGASSDSTPAATKKPAAAASSASSAKEIGNQVREALENGIDAKKRLVLNINDKPKKLAMITESAEANHVPPGGLTNPAASRQYIRARAAAMTGHTASAVVDAHSTEEVHWSYQGEDGPVAWAQLKPDFHLCAAGKRQSPINIEDSATLKGPAEPITFSYEHSDASVFNNGHTIQVDVLGDNRITVRGSEYKLVQFHFHNPSEERVNSQSFAMDAQLVHRNAEGQLAVVAVLLEPGAANPLIDKVWTYMPLDTGDRVRMPTNALELAQLLPKDQRYYQFMGSLTTPPCSEGVLWMVLKQPVTLSREQLRLFAQLFPNNARPVQAMNGRAVRNAQ